MSFDIPFGFNVSLYVECIVSPYGMIATLPYCIWIIFVSGTLEFMRWLQASLSAIPLP